MKDKVSLFSLFLIFAKIGVMTFGGGMAMLPMLTREVCEKKGWATTEEIANYYAIGQCTPGIIAVNTATFIGQKKRGILGGIFSTLGMVFPSLVIINLLAGIISSFTDNIYLQKAFMGIRACVCVLIVNTIIKLWKSSVKNVLTLFIFLVACIISVLTNISPVFLVLGAALIGVFVQAVFPDLVKEDSQ